MGLGPIEDSFSIKEDEYLTHQVDEEERESVGDWLIEVGSTEM